MQRIAFLLLLALAACASADSPASDGAPLARAGWRMASGQVPSAVEFGAVVASCQDRGRAGAASFNSCLTAPGLRRAP